MLARNLAASPQPTQHYARLVAHRIKKYSTRPTHEHEAAAKKFSTRPTPECDASPFEQMAVKRYSTVPTQHYQESPSPFDQMAIRRYSTRPPQHYQKSLSPFDQMAVKRYSTVPTQHYQESPSPFDQMAIRRYSTVPTQHYEESPSPFDQMAIRRYSTVPTQHYEDSPSPFDQMAIRRYSTVPTETNVVSSGFADVIIPDVDISGYVWSRVAEWPDKTAIVCGVSGRGYRYAELRAQCSRFAHALRRLRMRPGSVVAILLPNSPDYAVAMLGASEAGHVVTTINPLLVAGEISKQLLDSNPRVVVSSPEKHDELSRAIVLAGKAGYETPLVVIAPSLESNPDPPGCTTLGDMCAINAPEKLGKCDPKSTAVIPYSSGTTGLPKGVCLTHRNMIANIQQMQAVPEMAVARQTTATVQEVVPAVLPFYHIYGMSAILMGKLQLGAKIVTLPKFDAVNFLRIISEHKATILYLVPPLILYLSNSPDVTSAHLASVRYTASGAAPIGEQDVTRYMRKAPPAMEFMQGYGLTESSPCVFTTVPGRSLKLASVGRVVANTRAKIVSQVTGEALGPGEVGEVWVQGPQVMLGYHNQPEATAEMIDPVTGWMRTGDLGYYDSDEDFYIVDRLKELIKVKGSQVAPAELEEILRSHPQVQDAAVIGIPDARSGEVPLAFIVAPPGVEEAVKEFVHSQVAVYKQVKEVRRVEAIPKSPAGKILRKVLREAYDAGKL